MCKGGCGGVCVCKGGVCEWVDALAYGKRRRDRWERKERKN